jgi:hypothetical protein
MAVLLISIILKTLTLYTVFIDQITGMAPVPALPASLNPCVVTVVFNSVSSPVLIFGGEHWTTSTTQQGKERMVTSYYDHN